MEYHEWEEGCPLLLTQRILLGKWKLSIIWFLARDGAMRYSRLKEAFEDSALTQKMLTQHLKELQKDNLVERHSFNEVPPRVEYSLTALGKSFVPVLRSMEEWGRHYMEQCDLTKEHEEHSAGQNVLPTKEDFVGTGGNG